MSEDGSFELSLRLLKKLRKKFRTNATREHKAHLEILKRNPNREREEYHRQTWENAASLVDEEIKKLEKQQKEWWS